MVADQFPMFKLATLLARQVSAPVAARIKRYAVRHPRWGGALCGRVARLYRRAEWRARALALRLGGVRLPRGASPPPLPRRAAVELGGDLLGEMIVFMLGALIIIFEVNRQADKQEQKALRRRSERLALALALQELRREVALQQHELTRLRAALQQLLPPQHEPPAPPPQHGADRPAAEREV